MTLFSLIGGGLMLAFGIVLLWLFWRLRHSGTSTSGDTGTAGCVLLLLGVPCVIFGALGVWAGVSMATSEEKAKTDGVQDVQGLRAAYRSAGWHCESHDITEHTGYSETTCDDSGRLKLAVVNGGADVDAYAEAYHQSGPVLYGENWIITGTTVAQLNEMQDDLGGTVLR